MGIQGDVLSMVGRRSLDRDLEIRGIFLNIVQWWADNEGEARRLSDVIGPQEQGGTGER